MMEEEAAPEVKRAGIQLTEAERREFDNVTYDSIHAIKDLSKLKKMEAYFRQEGFEPTSQAVRKHMADLGLKDPVRDPELEKEARQDLEGFRSSLKAWTAQAKLSDQEITAMKSAGAGALHSMSAPPPRPPGSISVAPVKDKGAAKGKAADTAKDQTAPTTAGKAKPDSQFGGQVRSGSDYYQKWDKFTEKALQEDTEDNDAGAVGHKAVPGVKGGAGAEGADAGVPSAAGATGSALTAKQLELNKDMTPKERAFQSEQEKTKGNDHFRAKEYPQAVECYTKSLYFQPTNAGVYGNRAAAYFKIREFGYVVQDCDTALGLDNRYLKGYVRRAAARLELGQAQKAMEDIESGLALEPGNKELVNMQQRAAQALGTSNMKRMAITEVDDDDDDEEEDVPAPASKAAAQKGSKVAAQQQSKGKGAAAGGRGQQPAHLRGTPAEPVLRTSLSGGAPRTKITVIEESDSDSDTEQPQQQQQQKKPVQKQAEKQQPAAVLPGVAPSPARPASRKTKIAVVEDSDEEEVSVKPTPPPVPAAAKQAAAPATKKPAPTPAKEKKAEAKPTPASKPAPAVAPAAAPAPTPPAKAPAAPAPAAPVAPAPAVKAAATPAVPAVAPSAATPPPPVVPTLLTLEQEAEELKAQGNKVLGAGNVQRAVDLYTQALALQPDSAVLYLNRAMARLKLNDAKACLQDAAIAVALDPEYVKAMHKRGQAKAKMGMLKAAKEDLDIAEGLAKSPANKEEIRKERLKIEADVAAQRKAKAERNAKSKKVTNYKGGVTIEEHSDDEEEPGAQMSSSELYTLERSATNKSHNLKKKGETMRAQRNQEIADQLAAAEEAAVVAAAAVAQAAEPAPPTPAAPAAPVAATPGAGAPAGLTAEEEKEQGGGLWKQGDKAGASAAWVRALALCEAGSVVGVACLANLALVRRELGDAQGALGYTDTLLKIDPDNQKALHRRALALRDLGRLEEAMDAYRVLRTKMRLSQQVEDEITALAALITQKHTPATTATATPAPQSAPAPPAATATPPSAHAAPAPAAQAPKPVTPAQPAASTTPAQPSAASGKKARKADKAAADKQEADKAAASKSADMDKKRAEIAAKVERARAEQAAAAEAEKAAQVKQVQDKMARLKAAADSMAKAAAKKAGIEQTAAEKAAAAKAAVDKAALIQMELKQAKAEAEALLKKQQAEAAARQVQAAQRAALAADVAAGEQKLAAAAAAAASAAAAAAPAAEKTRKKIPIQEEEEGAAAVSEQDIAIDLVPDQAPAAAAQPSGVSSQQEADRHREAGNQLFKESKLTESLQAYDLSLKAHPTPAALANKALVLLKLNRGQEAEAACREVLATDPTYTKAKQRLGKALRMQGRLAESIPFFQQVAAEVGNNEVIKELEAVRQELAAQQAAPPPAAPPPAQPVRHKIQIQETNSSESEDESIQQPPTPAAAAAPAADRKTSPPAASAGSSSSSKLHEAAQARAVAAMLNLAGKRPLAPKSAVDFANACKGLGDSALVDYVSAIDPPTYPALFKESLDNNCLTYMLRALSHIAKEDPAFAHQSLSQLSSVNRFAMVCAMLSKADKAVVNEVLGKAAAAGLETQDLKKKYKC